MEKIITIVATSSVTPFHKVSRSRKLKIQNRLTHDFDRKR